MYAVTGRLMVATFSVASEKSSSNSDSWDLSSALLKLAPWNLKNIIPFNCYPLDKSAF